MILLLFGILSVVWLIFLYFRTFQVIHILIISLLSPYKIYLLITCFLGDDVPPKSVLNNILYQYRVVTFTNKCFIQYHWTWGDSYFIQRGNKDTKLLVSCCILFLILIDTKRSLLFSINNWRHFLHTVSLWSSFLSCCKLKWRFSFIRTFKSIFLCYHSFSMSFFMLIAFFFVTLLNKVLILLFFFTMDSQIS